MLVSMSCSLTIDCRSCSDKDTKEERHKFKYLGSIITPCLTENAEIDVRIRKAKSQMGILRHFFSCKDIELRVKYWVYLMGPLNVLLWGVQILEPF